jgi:hypothetical protein
VQVLNFKNNIECFNRFLDLKVLMGLLITSVIALILTVAGLLTSQNWSLDRSTLMSKYNSDASTLSSSTPSLSSMPPYLWQLKPSYYGNNRQHSKLERMARYDGLFDFYPGGAIEKSEFYYVLPILLVIGLGSFLIPIISTFFTALVTSSSAIGGCCGRRKRRGSLEMEPIFSIGSIYEVWDSVERAIEKFANAFDKSNAEETKNS